MNAPTMQAASLQSATGMMWEPSATAEDGVAIGVDLGCDTIRVAIWNAETSAPQVIDCSNADLVDSDDDDDDHACGRMGMPSAVAVSATKIETGSQALASRTSTPLVGVPRLLGRKFATLHGAKFAQAEDAELIGASLAPAEDEHGSPLRLKVACARPKPSGLKKRGAQSQVGSKAEPKSKILERVFSPEDLVYKSLLAAKHAAQAFLDDSGRGGGGGEITHATIAVPSHWGAAQRQAAFDCAVYAGLTPQAVVSASAAVLSLPAYSAAAQQSCVVIDWGAGGCSISATRGGKIVACLGDDDVGGLSIDRKVARRLASKLSLAGGGLANVNVESDANRYALLRAASWLKLALLSEGGGARSDANGGAKASVELVVGGGLDDASLEGAASTVSTEVSLGLGEWEDAAADAFEAVRKLLAAVIAAAGFAPSEMLHVLTGGGMCRSELVRTMLTRALGDPATFKLTWLDGKTSGAGGGGGGGGGGGSSKASGGGGGGDGGGDGGDKKAARRAHLLRLHGRHEEAAAIEAAAEEASPGGHVGPSNATNDVAAAFVTTASASLAASAVAGTTTVCGAAIIAAHRMQPGAVETALGRAWRELPDALPTSIYVEEAGGGSRQILPPLSQVGKTAQLAFAPSSSELTIRILEGGHGPFKGASKGASKGGTPLLSPLVDALVEPSPRAARSVLDFVLRRPPPPPPPQRTVTIALAMTGVVEVDCDSGGDASETDPDAADRPKGLGVGAIVLLLLLLASSVLGIVPQGSATVTASARPHEHTQGAGAESAGADAGTGAGPSHANGE